MGLLDGALDIRGKFGKTEKEYKLCFLIVHFRE